MKIAYFTDIFLPPQNGVGTSILNMSSALVKRGHEVIIFTPKPSRATLKLSSYPFTIQYLPSVSGMVYPDFRLSFPLSPRVVRQVKKLDVDIVHIHSPISVGVGGLILARFLKKPIVGTLHTYIMDQEFLKTVKIAHFTKEISGLLWKYMVFTCNQYDEVIAPCRLIQKDLSSHGVLKNITVIPNMLNESRMKRADEKSLAKLRKKLNIEGEVILFVGRLSKEKSIDVLIKSFALVLKKVPQATLLIIGDGPERKSLMKLARTLRIQEKIQFLGEIEQASLLTSGYLQIADVFATASISEVQPVSLIEAFYFGLPVVGVAKRGVADMVEGVGLLSKTQDPQSIAEPIQNVLINTKLGEELSQKSIKKYQEMYAPSLVTSEYEKLYTNLIKKNALRKSHEPTS